MRSRCSLQTGGGLTVQEARQKIAEKLAKEASQAKRKLDFHQRVLLNAEKKQQKKDGIEARKREKARKKEIKSLEQSGSQIPEHLLIPIPDPDVERKEMEEKTAISRQIQESGSGFIALDYSNDHLYAYSETDEEDTLDSGLY